MKTNQDVLIKTLKEGMRAVLDACHKEMMPCLGKTEADTVKRVTILSVFKFGA
jgi:hypothetical protein